MAYKRISPTPVEEGGTGAQTLTDHGLLVGSGTSAVTALTVGTNGQVPVGSTGADPVFATIASSDSLLTLTGGAGTLDITANQAVSASSTLTDNLVIRGDGGTRGVQTSTVSISDAGEMTNTSQPAFLGVSALNTSVTGDSTVYYFGDTDVGSALTEVYDQNSDFTAGASGGAVFTAPVTAKYFLDAACFVRNLGAGHTLSQISIITSNRSYIIDYNGANVRDNSNQYVASIGILADMDSSDTFQVTLQVNNSTKTVNVGGTSSYMGGVLIC